MHAVSMLESTANLKMTFIYFYINHQNNIIISLNVADILTQSSVESLKFKSNTSSSNARYAVNKFTEQTTFQYSFIQISTFTANTRRLEYKTLV